MTSKPLNKPTLLTLFFAFTLVIASGVSLAKELTKEELGAIVVVILGGADYESDSDGDGIPDIDDAFPDNPKENKDSDRDGVGDNADVFPYDATKTNSVVVNFSSGNVSSIVLNTDATSLGNSTNGRFGRNENDQGEDYNNIIAYDENGNEVDNAVETSDILFVAESVLTPDGKKLYLLTSPHMQRAFDLPPEVCSLYQIELASEAVDCLVPAAGDVQPKILNNRAIYSFSRKGIDLRADGAAVIYGLNYDRELPEGITGGGANGYAWFMSPEGALTGIEPSANFYIDDALWLDDRLIALFEEKYFELGGEERQWRVVDSATLEDAPNSPVATDSDSGSARGPLGLMLPGRIINKNDFSSLNRDYEARIVEDSTGNFFGWNDGALRKIKDDGTGYTGLEIETAEPGARDAGWYKQSGTGSDVKYAQVSSNDDFLAYTKGFLPRTPIVSIEGQTWDNGTLEIEYSDGAVTVSFGDGPQEETWWGVSAQQTIASDIVVTYQVSTGEGVTEDRTEVIPAAAINAWLTYDGEEAPRCYANMEACLTWANPEPFEEGFCLHKYGTDASQDRCIQFNRAADARLSYRILQTDMESQRQKRFDDAVVYPNQTGNAFPGVQTVALIDGRLQAYFKDSRDHGYYLAVADANNFWTNGDSALLFAPAQNASGDNVIITEATSLKPLPPLPLSGVSVTSELDGDAMLVSIELPSITETQGYEFNLFADTPAVSVSPLNGNNELDPTAGPTKTAANILTVEYSAADFESGQIYIAELPEHFMVNGSIRRRTPDTQLIFAAP